MESVYEVQELKKIFQLDSALVFEVLGKKEGSYIDYVCRTENRTILLEVQFQKESTSIDTLLEHSIAFIQTHRNLQSLPIIEIYILQLFVLSSLENKQVIDLQKRVERECYPYLKFIVKTKLDIFI